MRSLTIVSAAAVSLSIGACTLEPGYQRPPVTLPASWDGQAHATRSAVSSEAWWNGFGDPQLLLLLQHAVENSPELAVAVDRVMQAQDMVTVAHSAKFPVVGFSGLPTDPVSTQLRTSNSGRLDADANIFELAFNASYEIDFWGRVRSQEDAAHAGYRASLGDAGSAQIGLLSSVANCYFNLRALDEQLPIQQRRIDDAAQRLKLVQLRQSAGRTGSAPVADAQRALSQAQAGESAIRRERKLAQATLAVLTGANPETLHLQAAPLRSSISLQAPPEGLPSSLLERRPDLLAAEARLQSAHAQIAVAHAELFPQVALTATAGYVTGAVRNLAKAGSTVIGIGPEISLPIFDAGRRRAELDSRRWDQDVAAQGYRKTIIAALAEVESALLDYQGAVEAGERNQSEQALEQRQLQQIAAEIAAGRATRLDSLAAEDRLIDLDAAALQAYQQQLTSLIALYQALGGGWDADYAMPQRALVGAAATRTAP